MKEITTVCPYLMDGYLVIALHSDWMKIFDGIPKMVAYIDEDNHLHLISEKEVRNDKE